MTANPRSDAFHACLARLNTAAEQAWPLLQSTLETHQTQTPQLSPSGPTRPGISVEVLASIDSTNTELMRRARAGLCDPVLLVAVEQTAGRGRMGKTWLSQPGDSLTFSMALPMQPIHWAGLSLAVGVSLADTLAARLPAALQPQLQLKWPNDLWLNGAKLAGILVETAHVGTRPCVVVGVGINVIPPTTQALSEAVAAKPPLSGAGSTWPGLPPTGLACHVPEMDAASTLVAVAPALLSDLLAFETLGFAAFSQRFALRDALRDRPLVLSDGTQGTGCGVDDSGALLVLTDQGMRTVNSAEVSVRPGRNDPC